MDTSIYCRSFMDFSSILEASEIEFFVDASKNAGLGFGGFCGAAWMQQH